MNAKQLVEYILHEAAVPSVDEVCSMPGRSRGECWGCPITNCARQLTPFELSYEDNLTIEKAIQKLKNNQVWIGRVSGRQTYERILADCGGDLSLVGSWFAARLIEERERFLLNQAIESAVVGNQTIEKAAASVHYLGTATTQDKNIHRFKRMVEQRVTR